MLAAFFCIAATYNACLAHEGHEHDDDNGRDHAQHADHDHDAALMTTREDTKMLPPAKSDDVFHFVVYGDRTGGVPAGLRVLEQAVRDTNLLDPDLVMTVGDLVQGYNDTQEWLQQANEFSAIMNNLHMRWFPVAGNHDVYWRGKGPAPKGQHEASYEANFGPLWYSFQHKNAGFIVLYSDEGDSETNEKGFSQARLQMMSDEQLAFLDKALMELKSAEHVFIFLHHPRWIGGGYTGSNWPTVHDKLKNAGNVSAVFAGHIHHMQYDGPIDGIEYFTLATTGGHLAGDIPGAGYLHHLNMVSVRKDKISVSAMPVGAVFDPKDFTPEFNAQIELARGIRAIQTSDDLVLMPGKPTEGVMSYTITNPCQHEVLLTAFFDSDSTTDVWRTSLDHQHITLNPGQEHTLKFDVARASNLQEDITLPALRLQLEYVGESARIALPDVSLSVGVKPGVVPTNYFQNDNRRCLYVGNEESAVRVESDKLILDNGPMTLEAWMKADELIGYRGIIAKTEGSEYAFFSDEGVPQFDLNLAGNYVTVKAKDKLPTDRWTHLAGVFDGAQLRLYVDGKLVDSKEASGKRRRNKLPLFIGADPDNAGVPTRAFSGWLDEVRISSTARYSDPFSPQSRFQPDEQTAMLLHFDKNLGPFVLDHSTHDAFGVLGSQSKLTNSDR